MTEHFAFPDRSNYNPPVQTPSQDLPPNAPAGPRRRVRWVPGLSLLSCLGAAWLVVPPSTWGGGPSLAELRLRFEGAPIDASVDELRELMGTVCLRNEQALDGSLDVHEHDSPALPMEDSGEWRPSTLESGAARLAALHYQPAAAPLVDLLEALWPEAGWVPAVSWSDYRPSVLTAYLTPDHGWRLYEDTQGSFGGDYNRAFEQVWDKWSTQELRRRVEELVLQRSGVTFP